MFYDVCVWNRTAYGSNISIYCYCRFRPLQRSFLFRQQSYHRDKHRYSILSIDYPVLNSEALQSVHPILAGSIVGKSQIPIYVACSGVQITAYVYPPCQSSTREFRKVKPWVGLSLEVRVQSLFEIMARGKIFSLLNRKIAINSVSWKKYRGGMISYSLTDKMEPWRVTA